MGRVASIVGGVIAIAILAIAIILVIDVMDLQKNMKTDDKKFLLELDRRIEAGLIIGDVRAFEKQETFSFLEDIYQLNDYYIDEQFNDILGDSYKLFIFKEEAFVDIEEIKFGAVDIKTEDAFIIIKSFDEREEFAKRTGVQMEFIENLYATDNELETYLFARLVFSSLEQEGPVWLIQQIKKGNIVIHPKTITFLIPKLIPDNMFEDILTEEQIEKIKEGA